MTRVYNRKQLTALRRRLRAGAPKAERLLWWRLRGKQLDDLKFRRQYGVGAYVIDFYCPAAKLAIELDGESHFHQTADVQDAKRQAFVEAFGIRVLRFTNPQVYDELDAVVDKIWRVAIKRVSRFEHYPPQSPLGKGGGWAARSRRETHNDMEEGATHAKNGGAIQAKSGSSTQAKKGGGAQGEEHGSSDSADGGDGDGAERAGFGGSGGGS